jgi:hypothetical protein
MATEATWKPHEKHGRLTKQSDLPDTGIASPGASEESWDVQPAGTTMKAVVLDGPGPPSALHIRQVPRPHPQRGWVLEDGGPLPPLLGHDAPDVTRNHRIPVHVGDSRRGDGGSLSAGK